MAAGILRSWYEDQDEITRSVENVEDPHAYLFTDQQRARAARTQKAERAAAKADEHRRAYKALMEEWDTK